MYRSLGLVLTLLAAANLRAGKQTTEHKGLKVAAAARRAEVGRKEMAGFDITLTNTGKQAYQLYDLSMSPYFSNSFHWKIRAVKSGKTYGKAPMMMRPAIAKIPLGQPLEPGKSKTVTLWVNLDQLLEIGGKPAKKGLRPRGGGAGFVAPQGRGESLPAGKYELILDAGFHPIPKNRQGPMPMVGHGDNEGKNQQDLPFYTGKIDTLTVPFTRSDKDYVPDAELLRQADVVAVGRTYKMKRVKDGVVECTLRVQKLLKGELPGQDIVYRVQPKKGRRTGRGRITYLKKGKDGILRQLQE